MQPWGQFYEVTAGASATLIGLLFVAISMNLRVTLGPGHESARRMAEQAFQDYLAVLMVSLLALFAGISLPTFGLVVLCVTAGWTLWMIGRLYLAAVQPTGGESRFRVVRRHVSSFIGLGILTVTAARMALRLDNDLNWLASANLVLLFSATTVSWEILRRIAAQPPSP